MLTLQCALYVENASVSGCHNNIIQQRAGVACVFGVIFSFVDKCPKICQLVL